MGAGWRGRGSDFRFTHSHLCTDASALLAASRSRLTNAEVPPECNGVTWVGQFPKKSQPDIGERPITGPQAHVGLADSALTEAVQQPCKKKREHGGGQIG
ncbi:hypothetical protein Vi05172_g10557 [Venturia inaequalis]|nr:hypothetical protein Vi05172_g10557 [Venturia inaequalis]